MPPAGDHDNTRQFMKKTAFVV